MTKQQCILCVVEPHGSLISTEIMSIAHQCLFGKCPCKNNRPKVLMRQSLMLHYNNINNLSAHFLLQIIFWENDIYDIIVVFSKIWRVLVNLRTTTVSFVISVSLSLSLSVCLYAGSKNPLPKKGFSWNLILQNFSIFFLQKSIFFKIWQEKTDILYENEYTNISRRIRLRMRNIP